MPIGSGHSTRAGARRGGRLRSYGDEAFDRFTGDDGKFDVNGPMGGNEHLVGRGFWLRGVAAVDAETRATPSAGIGLSPAPRLYVDLACQHGTFPEVADEFGRTGIFRGPADQVF